jgi:hypothetical protein
VRSDLRLGDPGLLIEKGSPQMNRRADVAQDHKTCGVREEDTRKGVIHLSPGEGRRSLWVFGELMTHKVAGHRTGGAYALFGVTTPPGAGRLRMSSTARTSPSTCSKGSTSSW